MGLFNLKDTQVILDPNVLAIPEFKALWDRDKTKTKDVATKELSFVYYVSDFNSPYFNIPEYKREKTVIDDFIKDESWSPDEAVKKAIDKYVILTETPAARLVLSTRRTIDKLGKYLDEAEIDNRTVKLVTDTISKVSTVLSAYAKLEEIARKNQSESGRTIGNKSIGQFER